MGSWSSLSCMISWMCFQIARSCKRHRTKSKYERFLSCMSSWMCFQMSCLKKDFGQRMVSLLCELLCEFWAVMNPWKIYYTINTWSVSLNEHLNVLEDTWCRKRLGALRTKTKILSEINMSVKNYYQKCEKKWFLCLCTLIKIRNIQIQTILHKQQKWEETLTQHFIKVCAKFVLAKYGHKFYSTANKVMFNRGEISLKILKEFTIKTVIHQRSRWFLSPAGDFLQSIKKLNNPRPLLFAPIYCLLFLFSLYL
jgi:hypothetical protein